MSKWLFALVLLLQVHFVASYLVPLDSQAQREFGGLLRWAWPWSEGDSGPLGQVTTASGIPFAGLMIAMAAAAALGMAALAVVGLWVPEEWWRALTLAGATLSLVLMVLFFGLTKLLPIAVGLFLVWYAVTQWSATTFAASPAD